MLHTIKSKDKRQFFITLIMVLAATGIILMSIFKTEWVPHLFTGRYSTLLNHQLIMIACALVVLVLTTLLYGRQSLAYLSLIRKDGQIKPVPQMGIKPKSNETWRQLGRQMIITITLITGIVIYFQVARSHAFRFEPHMLLVFILAASNAFSEEIIYRFSLVASGNALSISHRVIELTSGLIFGLAHYFGNPGGLPGVLMAGFIGWFLAKSMNETKGFFWAYVIHFVQDVVIFYALMLTL